MWLTKLKSKWRYLLFFIPAVLSVPLGYFLTRHLLTAQSRTYQTVNPTAFFRTITINDWWVINAIGLAALLYLLTIIGIVIWRYAQKRRIPLLIVIPTLLICTLFVALAGIKSARAFDSYFSYNNSIIWYNPVETFRQKQTFAWSDIKGFALADQQQLKLTLTTNDGHHIDVSHDQYPEFTADSLKQFVYAIHAHGQAIALDTPQQNSSQEYKDIYTYATDPLMRKDAARDFILSVNSLTPYEKEQKQHFLSAIHIPDNSTARQMAEQLYFFPFGVSVPTADPEKLLYLNTETSFTIEYPITWNHFTFTGDNPIFLSPDTIVDKDGVLRDGNRAFTISINPDCNAAFRNAQKRFASTDDWDDFEEVEINENQFRQPPNRIITGPEVLNDFPNLGPVTHYHWELPHCCLVPKSPFTGNLEHDDYLFHYGNGRYKIAFSYNEQFKDKYWQQAQDVMRSFKASGQSCEDDRHGFVDDSLDYFFPPGYKSTRLFLQAYPVDQAMLFLDSRHQAAAKERSTWFTWPAPPKPLRGPAPTVGNTKWEYDPEFGYKCQLNNEGVWICPALEPPK